MNDDQPTIKRVRTAALNRVLSPEAVFVVTGCASGIGRRFAESIVSRGYRLMATDVEHRKLDEIAGAENWPYERVRTRLLDVRDATQWNAVALNAVNTFGRVDVLLNVAGYLNGVPVEADRPGEIDKHVDVNVKGVMFGTAAIARVMVVQGSGHIVNIASLAGVGPIAGMSVYGATKYAVRGFSLAAALELRSRGVYVTAFCPDSIQTPMLDRQRNNPSSNMMFSTPRPLTLDDVERALFEQVLPKRPFEYRIPRGRAMLARFADWRPALALKLLHRFLKQGDERRRSS